MTRYLLSALAALALSLPAAAQPSSTGPLAPPANGPRHADSTFVAIVDCTAHPTPGTSLDHATVVFHDGRIVEVLSAQRTDAAHAAGTDAKGPIKAPPAPAGARVIEGKGLHLYPGFIDACVEVDAPAPEGDPAYLHWNHKVTPQRSALDGAGIDAGTADTLRKLGFTTACISPRGGVFRGSSAVVSLAKPADEQSAAKPPVYKEKAYQSVAMEAGGGGYPSSEMGAIALIRQTFIDADWQKAARDAGEKIEPNCLDVLEQVWVEAANTKSGMRLTTPPLLLNTDDELETLRILKIAREFRRDAMVLGCGTEFQRLDAIKEAAGYQGPKSTGGPLVGRGWMTGLEAVSVVLPLNFPRQPDVSTVAKAESTELRDLMTWEQAPTNPRRLAKAGISFALTTSKLNNRSDFAANLKTALKYGLTEDQALAALTTVPAEMLAVSDQLGTIELGKRANLILADGPIFGEKTKLRTVFVDGQPHEISAPPIDVEGRWDLSVEGKPVEDHWLSIESGNSITVHLKDKNSKASKVSIEANKLSFVFEHEPLDGTTGVYVISAVVEKDAAGKPSKLNGQGLKATGEGFNWTGARQPPMLSGSWPLTSEFGDMGVLSFGEKGELTFPGDSDLKAEDLTFADGSLHFKAGDYSVSAKIDLDANPQTMTGSITGKEPLVQNDATGAAFFKSTRSQRAPRLRLAGSWLASGNDDAKQELIFDEENRGTFASGGKDIPLKDVRVDAEKVTFTMDRTDLDEPGEYKFELKIQRPLWGPPSISGSGKGPEDKSVDLAMTKSSGSSPIGKWRITKVDNKDLTPGDRLSLNITTRAATLTAVHNDSNTTLKSDQLRIRGSKVTISQDLSKLGASGQSSDSLDVTQSKQGATLSGAIRFNDGAPHAIEAVRVTDEPITVAAGLTMTQDEADRISQVPERLPMPFGPYGLMEQPKQEDFTLINATVWTSGPLGVLKNAYIRVKDGKIVDVNTNPPISVSGDIPNSHAFSKQIDCKGQAITPGIIDCHSHTGISRGVNEGGHSVTSECRISDVTDPDSVNWYRQLAGGVTTVNSLHGSANAIGGQSQTNKLRWGCINPDDMHFEGAKPGVKFALGENPRQVNFGGGGRRGAGTDTRYPASRMGVETLIRDRFTAAKEYDQQRGIDLAATQSRLKSLEDELAALVNLSTPYPNRESKKLEAEIASTKQRLAQAGQQTSSETSPFPAAPASDKADRLASARAALKDNETESSKVEARIKDIDDQLAKLKAGKQPSTNQTESLTKSRDQYAAMRTNLSANHSQLTARLAELERPTYSSLNSSAPSSPSIPPRRDLQLEALAEVLRGERLVHCHSYRQDEILMLCNVARDFNFKIGTFQHALEGYKIADAIRDTTTGGASGFADWWAYKVEVQDAIPAGFPIMHDVGVNVSFNSDSDELARRLNVDAAKAVKYGYLTPEEALKFVTINPAKQLQIDKRVGSIEVGKDADLALWNGDPLSAFSMCVATYVDGRCLFSIQQDEANRKTIATERQRLIQKILGEGRPKRDEADQADGDTAPRGNRGPGGGGGPGGRRRGPRPPQDQ